MPVLMLVFLSRAAGLALLSQDSGMETSHLYSMAVLQENVCSVAGDSARCSESLLPVPDPMLTRS